MSCSGNRVWQPVPDRTLLKLWSVADDRNIGCSPGIRSRREIELRHLCKCKQHTVVRGIRPVSRSKTSARIEGPGSRAAGPGWKRTGSTARARLRMSYRTCVGRARGGRIWRWGARNPHRCGSLGLLRWQTARWPVPAISHQRQS